MKVLSNIDLGGVAKIVNLLSPTEGSDLVSKSFVENKIDKAITDFDFQNDVKAIQSDATLVIDSPVVGDRYVIKDPTTLDSSFGEIEGLEAGDIVQYDGSKFVVTYDVSSKGDGVLLFSQSEKQFFKYVNNTWTIANLNIINAGRGLENIDDTFNVKIDNVSIGLNVGNQLEVIDKSITKTKLGTDLAGLGLEQNTDGSLKVKLNDSRLATDADGLKIVGSLNPKFVSTIGDGTATSFTVNHNFNTRDVIVQVFDNETFANISTDIVRIDENNITVSFSQAPTLNQYRVVIMS
ncbi:virion protein [Bacillus phage AR9]|uniref:Virion protein n=1 Tax=Bacillus phage AR9 TaxID=1815509 RepID=A0A172JIA1_BPPB1|nr:virion structural protein [Bacillus phage AR9]AMS01281.1 virion protein [Bacillus phage AR9]